MKKTPLYPQHRALGGRMVDFAGWALPLHYGSQIEEHHAVRRHAGMFDVSHMGQVDIQGPGGEAFLRHLLPSDVARLSPGQALYSCFLNEEGGILDDLIVYRLGPRFRLVVNAATREKDLAWLREKAEGFEVSIEERPDLAMIAVQGPAAMEAAEKAIGASLQGLRPFHALEREGWLIAYTGYTGERGVEVMLPGGEAEGLWQALLEQGVRPCGLGARDTLRLEAGLNLYGADMDETTLPQEAGLGWVIHWEPQGRDFIGRSALEGRVPRFRRMGLVLQGKGVLRSGQEVFRGEEKVGVVTSGSYAPTLGKSVALARMRKDVPPEGLGVAMRGRLEPVEVVKPPFVRKTP